MYCESLNSTLNLTADSLILFAYCCDCPRTIPIVDFVKITFYQTPEFFSSKSYSPPTPV